MSQMTTPPIRRTGGNLDVFTGLLFAAMLVLLTGVFLLGKQNMEHSAGARSADGGMFKLVE